MRTRGAAVNREEVRMSHALVAGAAPPLWHHYLARMWVDGAVAGGAVV